MMNNDISGKAHKILSLYEQFGHDQYFGENVSQLQHALQTAKLAQDAGADREVILAAFLHDIGHLVGQAEEGDRGEFGHASHDIAGSKYLRGLGFSKKICDLAASHVAAKRYLTAVDPEYFHQLSAASLQTLKMQGGPMSALEVALFSADAMHPQYLKLRRWDEAAKSEELVDESLESIGAMIFDHLLAQSLLSEEE